MRKILGLGALLCLLTPQALLRRARDKTIQIVIPRGDYAAELKMSSKTKIKLNVELNGKKEDFYTYKKY